MTSEILDIEDSPEVQILPGLHQTTACEGRIMVYRLSAVKQETLNSWSDHICQTLSTWTDQHPYMALFDLSNPGISMQYATLVHFNFQNVGITNRGGLRAEAIIKARHDLNVHVAICFNLTMSGRVGKLFSMQDFENIHPRVHYKSFYTRSKGLYWLAECL